MYNNLKFKENGNPNVVNNYLILYLQIKEIVFPFQWSTKQFVNDIWQSNPLYWLTYAVLSISLTDITV